MPTNSSTLHNYMKIFEKQEMKNEIATLFRPVIDLILIEIYPYVYISLIFIVVCFLLILGIFIILIRSNYTIKAHNL
jgi:hypothetical protein